MLSDEKIFLLECIRYKPASEKLRMLASKNLDYDIIYKMARAHKLESLMYSRLKEYNIKAGKLIERLEPNYYSTTARNMLIMKILKRVVYVLRKEDVPYVVIKGAALIGQLYMDISLRQMIDIDISIMRKDVDKVKSVMQGLKDCRLVSDSAYEMQNHEFRYLFRAQNFALPIEFSWERLLKKFSPSRLKDGLCVLKPEDNLVMLAVHLKEHHDYASLNWLVDIEWLLNSNRINIKAAMAHARKQHRENELAFTLYLVDRLFGEHHLNHIGLLRLFRLVYNDDYLFRTDIKRLNPIIHFLLDLMFRPVAAMPRFILDNAKLKLFGPDAS